MLTLVAVGNDEQWKALCTAMGQDKFLVDKRFSTNPLRVRNRKMLVPPLSRLFRKRTVQQWLTVLRKHGVPCARVYDVSRVVKDPQLTARKMIIRANNGLLQLGSPIKFSSPNPPSKLAPSLGQDSDRILGGLGYSSHDIERLRERKVFG